MSLRQCLMWYPGVTQILGGTFTFSHGITPSLGNLSVSPIDPGDFFPTGNLLISDGQTRITLYDCKLDRFEYDRADDGLIRMQLFIMDRRWKWHSKSGAGQISGYYNTRRNDNSIIPGTRKDLQSLCKLCLKAAGEDRFNVNDVPRDWFPEVEWDYTNPYEALASMLEDVGFRVVLGLADNRVHCLELGKGQLLPNTPDILDDSLTLDIPESPDELIAVAAKTRYQGDFPLEAVGIETDGKVKYLGDLSYAAKKTIKLVSGRSKQDPEPVAWENFMNLPGDVQFSRKELSGDAKKWIFHAYRIKDGFTLPGLKQKDIKREQVLPIESEQVAWRLKDGVSGTKQNLDAWVYGRFANELRVTGAWSGNNINTTVEKSKIMPTKNSVLFYEGKWSLDEKTGIVLFDNPRPIARVADANEKDKKTGRSVGELYVPAELYLRAACSYRDPDTRAWQHYTVKRKLDQLLGTNASYLMRTDVCYNVENEKTDNKREVDDMLNFYLDVAERQYAISDPRSVTYAGFKIIPLDGAIRQITFALGEDGKGRTRVSRNREELHVELSYAQRRLNERLFESLKRDEMKRKASEADSKKGKPAS